jgi:hypothetical protein
MPTSFTDYASSPLSILLTQALESIAKIKAKYASDLAEADTPEKKAAQNFIHLLESTACLLHQKVLPTFSCGQSPDLMAIAKILSNSRKLRPLADAMKTREIILIDTIQRNLTDIINVARLQKDKDDSNLMTSISRVIVQNKTELYKQATAIPGPDLDELLYKIIEKINQLNLQASPRELTNQELIQQISRHLELEKYVPIHPIVYELMEMMLRLAKAAPTDLKSLIPFFNPAASLKLFESGFIGKILTTLGGFRLEQLHKDSFVFELHYKNTTTTIDATDVYTNTRELFLYQTLEPALRRYLARYDETHITNAVASEAIKQGKLRVASEFARSKLLKDITTRTIDYLHKNFLMHLQTEANQPPIATDLPQLEATIHHIENHINFISASRKFRDNLQHSLQLYTSSPVIDLLQMLNDSSLVDEYKSHKEDGLDLAYCEQPLPNTIVLGTDGPCALVNTIIDVRRTIHSKITEQIECLQNQQEHYQEQINRLNASLIAQWQQECASHLRKIRDLDHQLQEIPLLYVTTIEEDANLLETESQRLLALSEEQKKLKNSAIELLTSVEQTIQPLSSKWLRDELQKQATEVLQAANTLIERLNLSLQSCNKEQQIIATRLQKILSNIRFLENLQSAHAPEMQLSLDEKQQQLAAVQEEKYCKQTHLAKNQATVVAQRAKQENLVLLMQQNHEKISTIDTELNALTDTITTLSQRISIEATPQNREHYRNIFEHLCIIQSHLAIAKKTNKIPFNDICKIMSLEELLPLLDSDLVLSDWKNYRERQDSRFKSKPSAQEYSKKHDVLRSALENKIHEIDLFLQIAPEIDLHKTRLQEILSSKHNLEQNIRAMQFEIERLALEIQGQQQENEHTSLAIDALHDEESLLKATQTILQQLIEILTDIDQFKRRIELFAENRDVTELPQHILDIKNIEKLLIEKIKETATALSSFEQQQHYQPTLSIIQQLLEQLQKRIDVIIEEKTTAIQDITTIEETPLPEMVVFEEDEPLVNDSNARIVREELVQGFINALTNYQVTRDQHYKIKDFFISADKHMRHAFITELKTKLHSYAESGDSSDVIQTIQEHAFPGKHLQPLLHKITADILEIGQVLTQPEQAVEDILAILDQNHPTYVVALRALYQQISCMQNYGTEHNNRTATALAEKLKQTTDRFITSHGASLPDLHTYQDFTKKFTARLHSEDNVMREHDHNWRYIAANIALALLLIPKLIYSKLTTGRCSFFFEETKASQLINAIDVSAHLLPQLAA